MSRDINHKRRQDLELNIQETSNLITKYEERRRLSSDPKEQLRAERDIEDLRAQLSGYNKELQTLASHKNDHTTTTKSEVGFYQGYGAATAHATPVWPETISDTSDLCTIMTNVDLPDPIFLLGAGASQKSGIPLRGTVVEQAAKRAFCRIHQRTVDDPTIRRSDWLNWLKQQHWYEPQQHPEVQYVAALTHLLQPAEERRHFLRDIASPKIDTSVGYADMLHLVATRHIRTILTTNFDDVLPGLARTMASPHHLTVIRSPDDFRLLSTVPLHPQLIYLHGDADRYAEQYHTGGYDHVNDELVAYLLPLLRDHPLIVIGYSGCEPSIMHHLLMNNVQGTHHYRHGVYWCVQRAVASRSIDPLVQRLASTIGENFRLVVINDFDTLMGDLLQAAQQQPVPLPSTMQQPKAVPSFDMQAVPNLTLDFLDWSELQQRLVQYCREMEIMLPQPLTQEAIIEQMEALDLVRTESGIIQPTVAGCLLFGKTSVDYLPSARVEVQMSGELPVIFRGNVWSQLRVIDILESEANVPFRLKGRLSETVTPYPALAIKEVIVNALAHRRYDGDSSETIIVRVEPDRIIVTSPGGLLESARRQIPPEMST